MSHKPVAAGKSSFDLIDPQTFFATLTFPPDAQILDAACGAGRYSLAIAPRLGPGGAIHGIDLWEEGIEQLRSAVRSEGLRNIHPQQADITRRLPLPDASIDLVLLATILHDLDRNGQRGALQEIVRVLKPGGRVAVVEFKKLDRGPGPPQQIRIAAEELSALLQPYGLLPVERCELGEFTYLMIFVKAER